MLQRRKVPGPQGPELMEHIRMALQALLRLEGQRPRAGIHWHQAKSDILRAALRNYLASPEYRLSGSQLRNSLS